MNIEKYETLYDSSYLSYKFQSIGPKGIINKVVLYQKMNTPNENYYNLLLGDRDEKNGNIDVLAVSNNNDVLKVLFTVAQTLLQFVDHYPDANILIVGYTNSRTRLYQMAIAKNIKEIEILFDIQGFRNDRWGKFKPGINFEAFLISSKPRKL